MKKTRILALLLAVVMVISLFGTTFASAEVLTNQEESDFEDINAKEAILVDVNTGTVLYELNADEKAYPASTTKIMTCLLVLEAIEAGQLTLDQEITAPADCREGIGSDSSTQHISAGEILTVEQLLYCMMVASANEAANILAESVSGSVDAFVEKMNTRAEELGCTGTHFVNPHGLHDEDHYTTAHDLYTITAAAWQYETFRTIVDTDSYTVPATNMYEERSFYNTNLLISEKKQTGYMYKYAIGVKTGTTDAAGSCLVAAAEYDGRTLLSVILGAEDTKDESTGETVKTVYKETRRLFRHGFLDFQTLTVVSTSDLIGQVTVTNGKDTDHVLVSPAEDVNLELVSGLTSDDFEKRLELPESVAAPVEAGDIVGTLYISYEGTDCASVNLVAVEDVEVSSPRHLTNIVGRFFRLPVVELILLVALITFIVLAVRSHRQRVEWERKRAGKRRKRK